MLCVVLASSASLAASPTQKPVVVELFQSQGCSSCPPANAVLNTLATRPDVIALNFAVTYWDQLGWKDTFAKPAYTNRQWDYARAAGRGNVGTPQMIVGGRIAVLGSRPAEVDVAILRARSFDSGPAMVISGNTVTVAAAKTAGPATLWLVRYDPRTIQVAIRAGENGGRTIPHRNVVRELSAIGGWNGNAKTFLLPNAIAGLETALLLQSGHGGPVIASIRT
ncbi:DUF1223 domain-containing protein (plasmid) [Sphingomonas paeninsulae]|uniref:DUF1223 domain-containing protein n=2 Tax=Sphingomonas paeninsulae TaxID=2319844 RepID=A0A494TDZ6_SPHPE|nr:DUF1223 domain-containing protein [Sphingomonas paeninsulae]